METDYLTAHAIARIIGVSTSAVLSWIDKGLLPAHRTPGRHRRVDKTELLRFLRTHGMPIPPAIGGIARVLLIDDDPVFLRTLSRTLRAEAPELRIDSADGGIDGLLKVGTLRPDAVVLDAYMPSMDGVEVCRRISNSAETSHVIVIAVTGRPSDVLEEAFVQAGAAGFLVKPVNTARLLALLRKAPEERRPGIGACPPCG